MPIAILSEDRYNQSTIDMKLRYLCKIFELFLIRRLNFYKFSETVI